MIPANFLYSITNKLYDCFFAANQEEYQGEYIEQKTLGLLPKFICDKIFSFCNGDALKNLSLVSSRIYRFTNDQKLWESLYLKEMPVQSNLLKLTWKQFYQNAIHLHGYQRNDPTFIKLIKLRLSPLTEPCKHLNWTEVESVEEGALKVFPNEIYVHIFSFCSAKALGNLSLVSLKINRLTNHPTVWRSLCLKEAPVDRQPLQITWKQFYLNAADPHQYRCGSETRIKWLTGATTSHGINLNSDWVQVSHFKRIIKLELGLNCNIDKMQIIFYGNVIKDDPYLKPLQLQQEGAEHLIRIGMYILS